MITSFIIGAFFGLFEAIFSILPSVGLGTTISSYLTLAIGYWNSFLETFPYLILPWFLFLHVIVPFEIAVLIAKLFLGSRTPAHNV